MGRMTRAGFIGMKTLTDKRCDAEASHATIDDTPMRRWCAM
jgi:hypothetical protein